MLKIKICGITNLDDALKIVRLKPEALGFVFYKKSPRYIKPGEALQIIRHMPKKIKKVGVFVNETPFNIRRIADDLKLDILQFHGDESAQFCKKFKEYQVVKALRIKDKNSLKNIKKYPVWGLMFDSYNKKLFGGSGRKFDWQLVKDIKAEGKNIFLCGGLNAVNVRAAIKLIKPDWIDASSAVEIRPGKKDIKKVKALIKAARKTL